MKEIVEKSGVGEFEDNPLAGDNPRIEDGGYLQPRLKDDSVEVEEDYLFKPIKENIYNAHDLIKNKSGSNLYQAYLYGLSKELDLSMDSVLELFLDRNDPDTVYDDYFDDMVYESDKLRQYEWELKQFMKKAGCDRDLFYNSHKCIDPDCGEEKKERHPCGSYLCPSCNDEEVTRRKKSMLKYVMDVPHAHFTFTVNPSMWEGLGYLRNHGGGTISYLYEAVEEAVKTAYKERYGVEVGVIVNVHTFSSTTLEWQPHADVFVSLKGVDPDTGELKNAAIKGMDPEKQKGVDKRLIEWLRLVFTLELISKIAGIDINSDYRDFVRRVGKNEIEVKGNKVKRVFERTDFSVPKCDDNLYWVNRNTNEDGEVITKRLFNVEDGDLTSGGLLGDSLRYFKRLPITDDNIINIEDGVIIFTTDKREREGLPRMSLTPRDFYLRLSQHLPPRNFRGLRIAGLYAYNHRYHSKVKHEHGYDLDGVDVTELGDIAFVIYQKIHDMGKDIEPLDRQKLGYIVVQVIDRLERLGIIDRDMDLQNQIMTCVRSLVDFACVGHDYDRHEREEKPVLSVKELIEILNHDTGKEVKEEYNQEVYKIYDKILKKVYSGLNNNQTCEVDGCGCYTMWVGFTAYDRIVSESVVAAAIFNKNDFKTSLHNMLTDSNGYFSCIKPAKVKDPPDGGGNL